MQKTFNAKTQRCKGANGLKTFAGSPGRYHSMGASGRASRFGFRCLNFASLRLGALALNSDCRVCSNSPQAVIGTQFTVTNNLRGNQLTTQTVPASLDLCQLSIEGFPKELVSFHAGVLSLQNGELHWDQGVLQFAPSVSGPWTDLPVASPFKLSPIGEKGFFRVKLEE